MFPKVNGREANQSPQGQEESGIKGGCEMGKSENNYAEEGQSAGKMEGDNNNF